MHDDRSASVEELAWATGADEADIRYVITEYLGVVLHDDQVPDEIVGEVHDVLNPFCERTVPAYHGQGGDDL